MPKCSYCEKDYEFPRGVTVVSATSGVVKQFCSGKCRKHAERKPKRKKRLKKKPWAVPPEKKKKILEKAKKKKA